MQIAIGNFLFRYRNGLGPVVFLLAILFGHPTYPLDSARLNLWTDIAGALITLSGQIVRMLAVGYEYIERGGRNYRVYASTLVRGGMFGLCRNPLYVGNILICAGVVLIVNSYVFYAMALVLVLGGYLCIVAAEEAFLRGKFGAEYEAYCREVPRWIPRLSAWSSATRGMRFNWRRVLMKEYSTIFMVLLLLCTLKLWSEYRIGGAVMLPSTQALAIALAIWAVLYLTARTIKKNTRSEA